MKMSFHEFYCNPRSDSSGGSAPNIYELWERGEASGDAVTPSTYCPEYRTHMVLKMLSLPRTSDRVFSIGCGNAWVEAGLVARGLEVQGIDCNKAAVDLATAKGVDAFVGDYFALPRTMPPSHFSGFGIVYADGLLGHLYQPDTGLDCFFQTLIALKPCPGTWLVLSNDAPMRTESSVLPHERLNDFWLISRDYLSKTIERFGFRVSESYHFPYLRPIRGLCNRTICVARYVRRRDHGSED